MTVLPILPPPPPFHFCWSVYPPIFPSLCMWYHTSNTPPHAAGTPTDRPQRIQPQLSGPSGPGPRHDARFIVLLTRSHHHAAHKVDDTGPRILVVIVDIYVKLLLQKKCPSTRHRGSIYCRRLALIASTFLTASLSVSSLCHLSHHQFLIR